MRKRARRLPGVGRTNEWDVPCLAFSPEGARLAGRAQGGWLWVWNLESGESSRIPFKDGREFGLVFSPDGALLATSGPERTIALLDADTLQPRAKLFNHTGTVCGLDFAPDGGRWPAPPPTAQSGSGTSRPGRNS